MKKLALILAFMLIPCAAFGLEMLTDNTMDNITGQDGVTIIADDIQLFLNVDLFAYVDADGYDLHNGCSATGCANGAMFGVTDFQMDTININAIIAESITTGENTRFSSSYSAANTVMDFALVSTSCGIPLFYNYMDSTPWSTCLTTCWVESAGSPLSGKNLFGGHKGLDNYTDSRMWTAKNLVGGAPAGAFVPNAINIDITDQLPTFSQAFSYILTGDIYALPNCPIQVMGVLITLPTMEIHIQEMHMTMALYDIDNTCTTVTASTDNPVNSGFNSLGGFWAQGEYPNRFGEIYIQGITLSILSGWVEIAPH
jgi:hypothetical protein